jgi:FkbM family methyltransferase
MNFEYCDIGTCDFDVADNVFDDAKNYLLIEPMENYLSKFPKSSNVKTENAACSNEDGYMEIYYIPESTIESYGLPHWMKGCNMIGKRHPVVIAFLQAHGITRSIIEHKLVRKISVKSLASKYSIQKIKNLKIDTEGHDHIIFEEFARLILAQKIDCDTITLEYIDGRYGNTDQIDKTAFSLRRIFPNIKFANENLYLQK